MGVMWTLLIPVLALSEGTNVIVGNYFGENRYDDLRNVVKTSLVLVIVIMLAIAGIGVLWWQGLSTFFNPNPAMVVYSVATFWWLIIPYIGFGISTIFRSVFYGTARRDISSTSHASSISECSCPLSHLSEWVSSRQVSHQS